MIQSFVVDFLILTTLVFYSFDGLRRGFLLLLLELIGTFLSLYLAILFGSPIGHLFGQITPLPINLQQPIGFLTVWLILQLLYFTASTIVYPKLPEEIRHSLINRIAGIFPSALKGLLMSAIILTLLVILPIENHLRPAIMSSHFGRPLVSLTQKAEQRIISSYSDKLTDTLSFLTTSPLTRKVESDNESIALQFKTTAITPDPTSEAIMLQLLNKERTKLGLAALAGNTALRDVGRAHAIDMLARGYFAHNTPEGKDPFQRMQTAGIVFQAAGENLAFAPSVELAHIGLMNSPKHRDNILDPIYGKVGIAVIDAGVYGRMFVQEFSD